MSQQSESISELAGALSKAQGLIRGAVKDASNPFFKSDYADLASVLEAIRVPFSGNGLSVVQTTRVTDGGHLILVTTLLHASGQWIRGEYPVNPIKNDPQSMGSAITYSRRYTLQAISGVAPVDDDGNAGSGRGHAPVVKAKAPAAAVDFVVPFGLSKGKALSTFDTEELKVMLMKIEDHIAKTKDPERHFVDTQAALKAVLKIRLG